MKYTVEGFVSLPVRLTVEAGSAETAAAKASGEIQDLAGQSYKFLKEKASNLAHPLLSEVVGEVTSVVRNNG